VLACAHTHRALYVLLRSAHTHAWLHVHAEHCVFCRFLSNGNSYKDCGHPCEKHKVHLRDEKGADHLVLADMGEAGGVQTWVLANMGASGMAAGMLPGACLGVYMAPCLPAWVKLHYDSVCVC